MLKIERWMPWHAEASADERFRAELIIGASALFMTVGLSFTVQTLLHALSSPTAVLFAGGGSVVFGINLVLLRRRTWFRFVPGLLVAQLLVLLSLSAVLAGGYRNFNNGWPMLVPLVAIFLIGARSGAICAAVLGLEGLLLWWLESTGRYIPPDAHLSGVSVLASAWGLFLVIVGLGILYERAHAARRGVLSGTIAQLQAAHDELAAAQRKLVAAEKLSSLGMLAAGVAHEINNPMAYVTSNVSALSQDLARLHADPELLKEYADEVLPATIDGIRRVNAIVADLRRFASGDPESFVEYDVNTEIAAALRMTHSELKRRQARIDLDLGPLPKVLGLPRQIMQVVMNLVVNAAQASSIGGVVRVASWAAGDEVAIKVQDSGSGMTPETLSRLFQPFFTTKPVGEGTGLGLAIAHGIVAAHGGRIDVASSPGAGSAFTLFLPILPSLRLKPALLLS